MRFKSLYNVVNHNHFIKFNYPQKATESKMKNINVIYSINNII